MGLTSSNFSELMMPMPGRPRRTTRLARALGLDGNPLRRASHRAEIWIRVGLLRAGRRRPG
jgi:hypothetical protein